MAFLSSLGSIFGWVYFVAWSATFWPQVLLVLKRRTTAGLSTDFVAINIVGFISYAIFTFASYTIPAVSAEYIDKTHFGPQVELADVLFAAHGAVMCTVLVAQLFWFPPRIPPHKVVTVCAAVAQVIVLVGFWSALKGNLDWYKYLSFAGSIKVLTSLIKHFPQIWLNTSRRSTVGWSFTMILLDVVGGSFSIAQQIVKAIGMKSMAPFTSNLAKTFLAGESLLFDFWFILQHLCFFTDRTDIDVAKPGSPPPTPPKHKHKDATDVEGGEHVPLVLP